MRQETNPKTTDFPHGRQEIGDRHIKLYDFQDGGLTAGLRAITIYLPDGYKESANHYPVVYFNDGGNAFSGPGARMDVDLAYDRLIADGLINPTIFVGIGIAGLPGRVKDLTPTVESGYSGHWPGIGGIGGGLDGYYRFLSERLKPYMDSHYRTQPEPASTGIAGYSLGGSSAFLMAFTHPETFGMAGCMSPSLWWGDDFALHLLQENRYGKKPVRFWLDGGGSGGDHGGWVKAARAYKLLEQKGWMPGDDLAAYFDYHADHRFEAGAGRMREMLHFLLRKEPLRLEKYRLVYAVEPTAPTMDLRTGHRRLVGAEARYANGLRLTVPQPDITVADASVVVVDAEDPTLLHVVGPGETTIMSTFQGHSASLTVIGYDPDALCSDLVCPPANAVLGRVVAADLTDWSDLPHSISDDSQNVVARFGVCHDAEYVHLVVRVSARSIVVEEGKQPWEQDSIGVRFDARPKADLCKGQGYSDSDEFLYIGLSPRPPGEHACIYPGPDAWERVLPAGIQATCVTAPGGYVARLSFPVRYLEEKQDGAWKVFRLNLCVSKFEVIGGPCTDARWQPDWLTFDSPIGSGIFMRGSVGV